MADPITREQVDEAIADMREKLGMWHVITDALGDNWTLKVPEYVRREWERGDWYACLAALTRWRDDLAAAEPVRRVARWDAELRMYALAPPCEGRFGTRHATSVKADAIAWGYEIEGGPEPKPVEDSSERLRERRGALGKERPAPRFKVWDWVRHRESGVVYQVGEVADAFGVGEMFYRSVGWLDGSDPVNSWRAGALEPASPPAPEVVDVPQPVVKRCSCPDIHDAVEATWQPGEPYLTVTHTTVPLALLRAMVEAIDAESEAPHVAALDAADAQGYARAMGEVVARCERQREGVWTTVDDIADWARERLPAAAEKEHGG